MNSPQSSLALGLAMLAGVACSATDNVDPPGYLFSGGTDGLSTGGRPNAGGVIGFTGGKSATSKLTGGAKATGGRAGTGGRRSPLT